LEDKVTSGSQETSRADIVRLGTAYGLSSRFTSFIAVDDTHRLPIGVANSSRAERPEGGASLFGASPMAMATQAQFNPLSCMSSMPTFVPAARYAPQGTLFGSANPQNGQFQNMNSTPTSSAWSPRRSGRVLVLANPAGSADDEDESDDEDGADDEGEDEDTPDTKEAVLVTLARLQRFDGSFASNSASVIELLERLGGDGARGVFEKHGLAGEVASVLLAWAWMSLCCDVEAEGMKEKADLWLHGNTEGFDVDAVQRELLNVVVFRPL
ncbi:hypothetical protein BJ138DRAFT_1106240, partial [Hygrophoropsis aurantiaca]